MKSLLIVLLILTLNNVCFSQESENNLDLAIKNLTGSTISVSLYPISVFFNGNYQCTYVSNGMNLNPGSDYRYYLINGTSKKESDLYDATYRRYQIINNSFQGWNEDFRQGGNASGAFGNFGFGRYMLKIENNNTERIDSVIIDFDYYPEETPPGDLYFTISADNFTPTTDVLYRFQYKFIVGAPYDENSIVQISYNNANNYTAKSWQPSGPGSTTNLRAKSFGPLQTMVYENPISGYEQDIFPLDSRRDCDLSFISTDYFNSNNNFPFPDFYETNDERQGHLTLNLTVTKNISTKSSGWLWSTIPTPIVITEGATMKLNPSVTYNINKVYVGLGYTGNTLTVQSSSLLYLANNSTINMDDLCKITLQSGSYLYLGQGASIRLKRGSTFCNQGANILGPGKIIFEGGRRLFTECISNISDYIFNDSTDIMLQDSAIMEIPDSTNLTFKGKKAALVLNKFSEIKLGANSKIIFDSTKSFVADNIKFTALDSTKPWGGIIFKNLDTINMNKCEIKGVKVDSSSNQGYAIVVYNSKNTDIDSCKINNSAGGIKLYFQSNTFYYPYVNISNNEIKTTSTVYNGINAAAYSSYMSSLNLENNTIENLASPGGGSGMFTYGIQSSTVKGNNISNFLKGIESIYSSFDLFKNTVSTTSSTSARCIVGITTTYNMGTMGAYWIGGGNKLYSENGYCVSLDGASFNLNSGFNTFNVSSSAYTRHLYGAFPTTPSGDSTILGTENCFQMDGTPIADTSYIRKYLIWANATKIKTDFSASTCGLSLGSCEYYVIEDGNAKDTVWYNCDVEGGGIGGGQNSSSAVQDATFKELYEGMNINMRKREFSLAETKCKAILDDYADQMHSLDVVSKLYYASLIQDVAGSKMSGLKSYFESYILNNSENTELVQSMFYHIQKCKVSLKQYSSALTGFGTIIDQFPTSYEGLAAKWDYMSTQLLDEENGQGGAERENNISKILTKQQAHEKLVSSIDDPLDKYDKTKFTQKDRKNIVKNIVHAIEDQRTKEAKKLRELESKVSKGSANETEQREYSKRINLKSVVRTQRIRNVEEQMSVVQDDIRKTLSSEGTVTNNRNTIELPTNYKLEQNYPNPFNPVTNIKFSLPKAGFVSLKIYDVTGRLISEMLNEVRDAGNYTMTFEGSNIASGVYFYRLESNNFVDTKRMVLVK